MKTTASALGASTPHIRSAAVMAFSRLVFEFGWQDNDFQEQLPSLLHTVLILMDENSREVIKSIVGLIPVRVAAIPAEQLQPLLPELVGNLTKYHKAKDRSRTKIKIILKKLVKMFGYEALMLYVPKSKTRLLTHMQKLDERRKRKKESGGTVKRYHIMVVHCAALKLQSFV
jgi:ribosomal RNA-processing protein 12